MLSWNVVDYQSTLYNIEEEEEPDVNFGRSSSVELYSPRQYVFDVWCSVEHATT
jgi:hypothetical protein